LTFLVGLAVIVGEESERSGNASGGFWRDLDEGVAMPIKREKARDIAVQGGHT
jgi:hypothetical protein